MTWSQALSFVNPFKQTLVLIFQGLLVAMTVTVAFISGAFEPIEQWGLHAQLRVQGSIQPDAIEFSPLPMDNHFVPLRFPRDFLQQTDPNFFKNEFCIPSCALRWSKVLANAYTLSWDKAPSSPTTRMAWKNEAMTLGNQAGKTPSPFPTRVSEPVVLFLILVGSLVAVWLSSCLGNVLAVGVVGLLGVAYLGMAYGLVAHSILWVDLVPVPLALVFGCAAFFTKGLIQETSKFADCTSECSSPHAALPSAKYAPRSVSQQRQIVTVLFADIRGFSRMAETLSPEEVCDFLGEYYTEMTEAVVLHGGTIDKYMGDAVMALFNASHSQPDHARRAVNTALDCQRRLRCLAAHFQKQYGSPLACGIGIHTGEVLVVTMGSAQRTDYTAVGDTVNLAANLEELSKVYRVPIVMSESTHQAMAFSCHSRYLDEVRVKGRERFMRIHTVIDRDDRQVSRVPGQGRAAIQFFGTESWGEVSDWSPRGMALEQLEQPIGEGSLLDLTLYSSDYGLPLFLRAKVIWAQSHRAGLEFVEFNHHLHPSIENVPSRAAWEQYTQR
jgi:class 3 adenylate cyclase